MKLAASIVAAGALLRQAAADYCSTDTLLGLASPETLPYTFSLLARNASGSTWPVVQAENPLPGGYFFPLSLGAPNTSLSDPTVPVFTLQGETAYVSGGLVTSTFGIPLLGPLPIYASSDNRQNPAGFNAVNVTCNGKPELSLRFTNLTPIPLASASVNNTFAVGSAIQSPILDNLLTLFSPIDLIVVPVQNPTSRRVRRLV